MKSYIVNAIENKSKKLYKIIYFGICSRISNSDRNRSRYLLFAFYKRKQNHEMFNMMTYFCPKHVKMQDDDMLT